MKPAPFSYAAVRSVEEALALLSETGDDAKLLAGGQSLGPLLNLRLAFPELLIDINRVDELDFVRVSAAGQLCIGALVRHRDVETSHVVQEGWPMLASAVSGIGHRAIRNRGTLGGSVAHADPAAELPSALTALGATLEVRGGSDTRSIPAREFFLGPFATALRPDELLMEIRVPQRAPRTVQAWMEFSRRSGDFGIVGVAASFQFDGKGRCTSGELVYSGVESTPWHFEGCSSLLSNSRGSRELAEEIGRGAARACSPASDDHATSSFRRQLVRVLTTRALGKCIDEASHMERSSW